MTEQTKAPICPRCRGTGIARVSPYLVGLRDGDLHTMTACDCPAGKALLNGAEDLRRAHAALAQKGGE